MGRDTRDRGQGTPVLQPGRLARSFGHARDGLAYALRTQQNLRVHAVAAAAAVTAAAVLGLSATQWAVLAVAIALVVSLELVNTAVEALVDAAGPEYRRPAKVAKDTAAAAVLVAALLAVAVGGLLFVPAILDRL